MTGYLCAYPRFLHQRLSNDILQTLAAGDDYI